MGKTHVVFALDLGEQLAQKVRDLDPRIEVTVFTRGQARSYRRGRATWSDTLEPPQPGEDQQETERSTDEVLAKVEIILGSPAIEEDVPRRAPNLRWVQLASAGADRLLSSPLLHSGITITTASGIHAVPIGEYVIGVMLAFAKGLPRAYQAKSKRQWDQYASNELYGKTVGIIGLGAIGGHVAKIANFLGMRVLAVRRSAKAQSSGAEAGFPEVDELLPQADLPYVLSESDYVVLAVPLTQESTRMIGEAELRAMKPSAVIVNIARGAVIDEPVLIRALREKWIAGAALDVFEREPLPPDSPLWDLGNVILTSHVSGGTPRYWEMVVDLFCDNLRRYLAGQPLRNVISPERGY